MGPRGAPRSAGPAVPGALAAWRRRLSSRTNGGGNGWAGRGEAVDLERFRAIRRALEVRPADRRRAPVTARVPRGVRRARRYSRKPGRRPRAGTTGRSSFPRSVVEGGAESGGMARRLGAHTTAGGGWRYLVPATARGGRPGPDPSASRALGGHQRAGVEVGGDYWPGRGPAPLRDVRAERGRAPARPRAGPDGGRGLVAHGEHDIGDGRAAPGGADAPLTPRAGTYGPRFSGPLRCQGPRLRAGAVGWTKHPGDA